MSTGKVIFGTLAGLAIGAIAGILFAPEKGSTTRRQIMDIGDDYVDKLKSKYKKENTKYDDVKRDVKNAAANIKYDVAEDINNVII